MAIETPDDAVRRMSDYIKLAFRNALPSAGGISVAFLELVETWIVSVDREIYAMTIGSDDDEFSFRCVTDPVRVPRVVFDLMPEPA